MADLTIQHDETFFSDFVTMRCDLNLMITCQFDMNNFALQVRNVCMADIPGRDLLHAACVPASVQVSGNLITFLTQETYYISLKW